MSNKKAIKSYGAYATEWARKLRAGENMAHKYLEKPAMYSKLPDLIDKAVLCLGCGTGEECDYIFNLGVKRIVGIDISKESIGLAKKSFPKVEFHAMDMQKLKFPVASFDYVFSSLAINYLKKWTKSLREVHRVLKHKGIFLFSAHHPVKWGANFIRGKRKNIFTMGYVKHKNNSDKYEIFGDYLNARKIDDIWFEEFPVTYYHRPLSATIRDILDSGFEIVDFLEPKAINSAKYKKFNFWQIHQKIPLFMIFELKKKFAYRGA